MVSLSIDGGGGSNRQRRRRRLAGRLATGGGCGGLVDRLVSWQATDRIRSRREGGGGLSPIRLDGWEAILERSRRAETSTKIDTDDEKIRHGEIRY